MTVVCGVLAGGARAAEETGISVAGTGEVKAKPNQVEVSLRASGSAELTGDAIVKYRDALRRTREAFAALKMKNLSVEQQGLSIASAGGANPQQMVFGLGGQGQAPVAKAEVAISRELRLVLRDIEEMPEDELMETIGKLLDTAKDSGATVGPSALSGWLAQMYGQGQSSSVVTFVLENADEVREQAYQKAFEQARARAQRLADLAGVRLGRVLSVHEAPAPSGSSEEVGIQQRIITAMYGMADAGQKDDPRVTSETFAEIPVRVTLQVRFAIEEKAEAR